MSEKIWIAHIRTEDGEDYYKAFKTKPSATTLEEKQLEILRQHGFDEEEGWEDLVYVKRVKELDID